MRGKFKNPRYITLFLLLSLFLSLGLAACSSDTPTDVGPLEPTLYPADGAVLTTDFDLSIGTNAVDSIVIFLDGARLAVVMESPFVWPVALVNHSPGDHTWDVTVHAGANEQQLSAEVLMCHGIGLNVGNFAPTATMVDLDGVTQTTDPSPGTKAVLLDFWATWCPPCISALPETQRLFEVYGDQGLKVLTINDEDDETVRPFMRQNEYTFPVLHDPTGFNFSIFGVRSIPTYFIIDHRGVVRFVQVGGGGTPLEEVISTLM